MTHETRLPAETLERFRKATARLFWRKATQPQFYGCPHEYVIRKADLFRHGAPWGCSERDFQFLAKTIATYGERMKWRHRRDVCLFDGDYVYFVCGPCLNRSYRESMENSGYPSPETLAMLRARFWPTKADRQTYRE